MVFVLHILCPLLLCLVLSISIHPHVLSHLSPLMSVTIHPYNLWIYSYVLSYLGPVQLCPVVRFWEFMDGNKIRLIGWKFYTQTNRNPKLWSQIKNLKLVNKYQLGFEPSTSILTSFILFYYQYYQYIWVFVQGWEDAFFF